MATMLATPMAMLPMVPKMGTMPTTTQVVAFRTTGVDTAVVVSATAAVVVEMGMVTTTVTAMFTPVGTVTATGHGATAVVEMETGVGMVGCPKLVRAKCSLEHLLVCIQSARDHFPAMRQTFLRSIFSQDYSGFFETTFERVLHVNSGVCGKK